MSPLGRPKGEHRKAQPEGAPVIAPRPMAGALPTRQPPQVPASPRAPQRNIADFGMDTITLAGPLEAKLAAMAEAGFGQVMLKANDIVGHPGGVDAAVAAVKASGLKVTGFQVLRDFEGLAGHLHGYKVDIAKAMLEMAAALGAPVLLACSSTSRHATGEHAAIARDLHKLAMLALPLGIRIAFEGLSWGRHINEYTTAWEVVNAADAPNLGLGIDSYHIIATQTPLDGLGGVDPGRIFLVQLSDFMWQSVPTAEERISTARTFRVFPGEGVHSAQVAELVTRLDALGYRGDYSFEVFNDDYQQLPLPLVADRARRSAEWLGEEVLRRSVPLPNRMRLKSRTPP
jgi:sugar phosphate isomerase/epimerase